MNKTAVITTAMAGAAFLGASFLLRRQQEPRVARYSTVIPIITPIIDFRVAEMVLEAMEHLPSDDVTVVLHTLGGCVTSCVMICNALRAFPRSTAIVPYMATSGGTLIALNATHLQMGRSAALSAVDPIVHGQRAKHLPEEPKDPLQALAHEYQTAITNYLRDTLLARLPGIDEETLWTTVEVFLGEHAPDRKSVV